MCVPALVDAEHTIKDALVCYNLHVAYVEENLSH